MLTQTFPPLIPDNPDRVEFDVDAMAPDDLDRLPVGAIKVDAEGRILFYNETESRLSGRSPERVIGRRFFHEVAPCTNMPGFFGRFTEAVVRENAHVSFSFVFDFSMRPVRVRIDMRPAAEHGQYWILVRPIEFLPTDKKTDAQRVVDSARIRVVGETVDTTICDRELIHLPGAIQPHGALIAIRGDLTVVAASDNLGDLCGVPAEQAVGGSAELLFPAPFLRALVEKLSASGLRETGTVMLLERGEWRDFIAHASGEAILLEIQIEPTPQPTEGYQIDQEQGFLEGFFFSLIAAPGDAFLAQEAARRFRQFTGYDRILIYRFDTVGNGLVVAEDKVTEWDQSLVGLKFPASDIPKQARDLYLRSRIRHTPNNAYLSVPMIHVSGGDGGDAIDLGNAALRSISAIHREYHHNMGVVSSFSASILVGGELWGLVIGHHRTPRRLSWTRLSAVERAAELLGPRMAQAETQDAQTLRKNHEQLHRRFLEQMAASEDLLDSLKKGPLSLTELFPEAVGAVAQMAGRLVLVGETPDQPTVRRLIRWLQESIQEDVWSTDCISGHLPEMLSEKRHMSGLLVSFLTPNHQDLVMWFRPEAIEAVIWAGDPAEKTIVGGALQPRKRFEHWIELKSAHSKPWSQWKLELASRLSHAVTAVCR